MITLYSIFQDFIKQTKIYIQNVLPKKVSELTNDAGYLTSHQDISGKQDKLTFDTTPTANSSNPVTSGGVKTALDTKLDKTGTAVSATKLQAARTISLTGNASGSVTFDGTSDVSINTIVNESKHAAVANTLASSPATETSTAARPVWLSWENDNTAQTVSPNLTYTCSTKTLTAKNFKGHLVGNADTATTADNSNKLGGYPLPSKGMKYGAVPLVRADGVMEVGKYIDWHATNGDTKDFSSRWTAEDNGTVSVGTINGTLEGNADSATKLATARAISLTGNASGSANFDGSGNVSINTTVNESKHAAAATALDIYAYRPADANIQKGDGLVRHFLATSDMSKNKPPVGDGHILSFAWDNNDGFDAQLCLNNTTGRINMRGQSAGKWSDWLTVLDSANFNSYAPTKTGVGASGTWPISVSGNATTATKANTASSVAWSGVTDKPGTYPPSAHNHDSAYPSVTGARASGTWGISITGNAASATNADKVDGYHASDLLRILGGNRTPVITDIFDRAGTIDMSTMSAADKAKHKANINKASNVTQNIWNNSTGIHAYGGDLVMNGYSRGALKLTQSYKNFDKIFVVGSNDDGNRVAYKLWNVYELVYAFSHSFRFKFIFEDDVYWTLYGSVRTGTDTDYVLSTDTILNCQDQNCGIIAIYGIKY